MHDFTFLTFIVGGLVGVFIDLDHTPTLLWHKGSGRPFHKPLFILSLSSICIFGALAGGQVLWTVLGVWSLVVIGTILVIVTILAKLLVSWMVHRNGKSITKILNDMIGGTWVNDE